MLVIDADYTGLEMRSTHTFKAEKCAMNCATLVFECLLLYYYSKRHK